MARLPLPAGLLNRLGDSLGAELALGEQAIVCSAHQAQIFDGVFTPDGPRSLVMKLQECVRFAAMPI